MKLAEEFQTIGCQACREGKSSGIEFTMAFQPIVDMQNKKIFGYEALARGPNNESAYSVLSQVNETNRYAFDQTCRVKAIDLASKLGLKGMLSINFLPGAVYNPKTCIRATLEACTEVGFPIERLMFEVTENEEVKDGHLKGIFEEYKRQNFMTAFDDFGAGYSNLNLLADFQPDLIKLDMALTRNIDNDRVRRTIVIAILTVCRELSIQVIAEGIETVGECNTLLELGVILYQGYYFAKPGFETLPEVSEEVWKLSLPSRNFDRRRPEN